MSFSLPDLMPGDMIRLINASAVVITGRPGQCDDVNPACGRVSTGELGLVVMNGRVETLVLFGQRLGWCFTPYFERVIG